MLEPAAHPAASSESVILAAARDEFARVGYQRTTIDAIARRAYVSRSGLYYYFADKNALRERLLSDLWRDIAEAFASFTATDVRPAVALEVAAQRSAIVLAQNTTILQLHETWWDLASPALPALTTAVAARLVRDQQEGIRMRRLEVSSIEDLLRLVLMHLAGAAVAQRDLRAASATAAGVCLRGFYDR